MKTETKTFMTEVQELGEGLIIFKRNDVQHDNWHCRVKIPKQDRYKFKSLETADVKAATREAFRFEDHIKFRIEHDVPLFEKTFEQVAIEYSEFQERRAAAGQITKTRWTIINSYITNHLIPYAAGMQIAEVGDDEWDDYPRWRKEEGMNRPPETKPRPVKKSKSKKKEEKEKPPKKPWPAKDGTIVHEMKTFRGIMNFAAKKRYIAKDRVPDGKLPQDRARREAFTPGEYKQLYTYSRETWVPDCQSEFHGFYRTMAHNYMLVMTNTGMRPSEARNLRWRDVDIRSNKSGQKFVFLNVWGKDKYRELVAPITVETYLNRIRECRRSWASKIAKDDRQERKKTHKISAEAKPDDFVFINHDGTSAVSLYASLIMSLLEASGLQQSSTGSRRTTYCFRHTYATFRLMHGTDVYFLAKQMGTSVQMIEKHYGHITPSKNADAILQGLPGWELLGGDAGETASDVNEDAAGKQPKARTKGKSEGKDLPTAGKASRSTRRR